MTLRRTGTGTTAARDTLHPPPPFCSGRRRLCHSPSLSCKIPFIALYGDAATLPALRYLFFSALRIRSCPFGFCSHRSDSLCSFIHRLRTLATPPPPHATFTHCLHQPDSGRIPVPSSHCTHRYFVGRCGRLATGAGMTYVCAAPFPPAATAAHATPHTLFVPCPSACHLPTFFVLFIPCRRLLSTWFDTCPLGCRG